MQQKHGFLVRLLYFLLVGWWFGYLWLIAGFALCILVVTLPLGLTMLNRLPRVLTLRSVVPTVQTNVTVAAGGTNSTIIVTTSTNGSKQRSMIVRSLYFVFVGWWFGFLWSNVAYLLCILLLTLPIGLAMFNRLPRMLTLRRD